MTRLGLRPYRIGDYPAPRSVPVTVVVLTHNEEQNIRRCLASVAWADQVVVIDSGSTDDTLAIANSLGADVVEQAWLGFSAQREFALRLGLIRHNWVQFVDADQWVSPQLAGEVASLLRAPTCAAFAHRFRLIFLDTWIRHCGWYKGSWNIQLMDRRYAKYDGSIVGERVCVDGEVQRMVNDIVDDDHKGLASWLLKHVHYAQLEAARRCRRAPLRNRLQTLRSREDVRPFARAIMKDILFPSVPAKPVALFFYMYFFRLGFLDGKSGLRFCFYHAWYELSVATLQNSLSENDT
jgi:glycosyltransferase involved in cell wall biosynthesis